MHVAAGGLALTPYPAARHHHRHHHHHHHHHHLGVVDKDILPGIGQVVGVAGAEGIPVMEDMEVEG